MIGTASYVITLRRAGHKWLALADLHLGGMYDDNGNAVPFYPGGCAAPRSVV